MYDLNLGRTKHVTPSIARFRPIVCYITKIMFQYYLIGEGKMFIVSI